MGPNRQISWSPIGIILPATRQPGDRAGRGDVTVQRAGADEPNGMWAKTPKPSGWWRTIPGKDAHAGGYFFEHSKISPALTIGEVRFAGAKFCRKYNVIE